MGAKVSEKIEKNSESKQYNIDSVTGFIEDSIPPRVKTAFLKALKANGNQSAAATKHGITWAEMDLELKKDPIFHKAYMEVLTDMKHELESILYTKAIDKKDTKSALSWLSAKFPDEYRTGAKKADKKDNKEKLFDRLLND